jgi:hypothetical protein
VRRLAIAIALAAGLTACGSNPALTHAGPAHGKSQPFAVGEPALERASGATVTVLGFDAGPLTSDLIPLKGASRLTAADVRVCEGRTGDWTPDPDKFTLQLPGHDPLAQTLPAKLPALDLTRLTPGACVEGWVTFLVPDPTSRAGPTYVIYRDSDASAMWKVA